MRSLVSLLKEKVPRRQLLPLASVTGATVVNNLMAFAVQIFAARVLGAERFGVFSLAFSVATLAGAVGDLGFNLGMIRLFNKYQAEPEKQAMVLGTALSFKVPLFAVIAVTCLPLGGFLTWCLGLGPKVPELFAVALLTGGFLFFWTYLQSYLQAHCSFKQLTGYILAYFGLRLASLLVVYKFFPEDPLAWLLATYTAPILALTIVGVVPKGREAIAILFKQPGASLGILRELLNYSKWVALSGIAYMAMPYVVRFILAVRASVAEVGIFSVGMTFTMAFTTLNAAVQAVFFPQVTALEGQEQMERYLRKLRDIAPYYLGFATAGIVALAFLQWLVLGGEYHAALPVFMVTAGAFAISVLLYLATMLLHTLMRPDVDTIINVLGLVLLVALTFLVAGNFGALGVAVVYGSVIILGGICKCVWLARII